MTGHASLLDLATQQTEVPILPSVTALGIRQMAHVTSGDVFRLWTANFSADKEPNSQGGSLKHT